MSITPDDVRHIAALARLGLDEARLPALVGELNRILEHMAVLQRVDVAAGLGDAPETAPMPLREDGGVQLPLAHPREAFAPAMRDGFLLVPRLATHETADE